MFGAPIEVQRNDNPTKEEIAALHEVYLENLTQLFETNKEKFGVPKETKLQFVWLNEKTYDHFISNSTNTYKDLSLEQESYWTLKMLNAELLSHNLVLGCVEWTYFRIKVIIFALNPF